MQWTRTVACSVVQTLVPNKRFEADAQKQRAAQAIRYPTSVHDHFVDFQNLEAHDRSGRKPIISYIRKFMYLSLRYLKRMY